VHLNGELPVATVAQALTQSGKCVVVEQSADYRAGVIDGFVHVADLPAIAKTRGVQAVVLSLGGETQVGSVTQQALVQHRVDQIAGLDGPGFTIGVLSDSYNIAGAVTVKAAHDIASGDLPGAGN